MEKYGVDVDAEIPATEKRAEPAPRVACPKCTAPLEAREGVNVPKCPKCGTEPFERP